MTFETDVQEDVEAIINGEFSRECIHTPRGGVAQPAFNCLLNNAPMHGDEVKPIVFEEDIGISVISSEVTAVKKRDFILVTGTSFEVINDPVIDLGFAGTSVINLRTERTRQTKI